MTFSIMLSQMAIGMGRSIGIFFLTLIFSMPLGLLVSFGRMSKIKPVKYFTKFYISVLRGTPSDAAADGRIFLPLLPVRLVHRKLEISGNHCRLCD